MFTYALIIDLQLKQNQPQLRLLEGVARYEAFVSYLRAGELFQIHRPLSTY